MIENMRHIRRGYENNCRLMRGECIPTWQGLKTERENVVGQRGEMCDRNDAGKEITLHDWYISLTSHLSVILIGKK